MRLAARERSLQQADKTERGIAGLVVASLEGRQFPESQLASLLQFRSLRCADGTRIGRKLKPQLKSTLQLCKGPREASMDRASASLAAAFTRTRLEMLL